MNNNILQKILIILSFSEFLLIKVLLISLLLFFNFQLLKKVFKVQLPNGYEPFEIFKVNNRLINWLWCIFYIILFICIILFLRFYRMHNTLDLKPMFEFIKFFIIQKEFCLLLIFFLIILLVGFIIIYILKHLKTFLEIKLLSQHIILLYPLENYVAYTKPERERSLGHESPYREFLYWVEENIGYSCARRCIYSVYSFIMKLFKIKPLLARNVSNFITAILDIKYNMVIIPILVIYDIILNNLIISKIFVLLPFYLLYTLWYKFTKFQSTAYPLKELAEIVYEIYYCKDVTYCGLDEKDLTLIYLYVRFGLCGDYLYDEKDALGHTYRIRWYCRFVPYPNYPGFWHNPKTKEVLKLSDNTL